MRPGAHVLDKSALYRVPGKIGMWVQGQYPLAKETGERSKWPLISMSNTTTVN